MGRFINMKKPVQFFKGYLRFRLTTHFIIPLLGFLDIYMLRFLINISRSLSKKAAPVYITVLGCTGKSLFYMALLAWKNITAVYAHRCALE